MVSSPFNILFEILPDANTSFSKRDLVSIRSKDIATYQACLGSLRARKLAASRSLKSRKMTAEIHDDFQAQCDEKFRPIVGNLTDLTDSDYVRLVWSSLDKTCFPEQVYGLLKNVLEHSILELRGCGRKSHDNSKASQKVKEFYGAQNPEDLIALENVRAGLDHLNTPYAISSDVVGIWCPVLANFKSKAQKGGQRKMAHIIPVKLGEQNLCALLGYDPDSKPMNNPTNLMYLDAAVEAVFDNGQITFVPADPDASAQDTLMNYKLVVLDESILNSSVDGKRKWKDFHNQPLVFRNDARPAKRNMYLHNVLSYLRAQVLKWGGTERLDEKVFASRRAYATPEAFLRSDMLAWLSTSTGTKLPKGWADYCFNDSPGCLVPNSAYLQRRSKSFATRWAQQSSDLRSSIDEAPDLQLSAKELQPTGEDNTSDSEWESDSDAAISFDSE